MVWILEEIAKSVEDQVAKQQMILLLDVAPAHLDTRVTATANRLNLWLLYVPAKLTFLLQPLDVACLQAYKSRLNKSFVEKQDSTGTLKTSDWFDVLISLSKTFWRGRHWKNAFQVVGLMGKENNLSDELRQLGLRRSVDFPIASPTVEELQDIWPKRKRMPFESLFWLPAKLKPDDLD